MPVHSKEKKESNHEEMDVDYAEQEGSSSDEEDTESSSVSEDGESSEMDDEDCERRRMECLDEMTNLEKQFTDLKDQLYKERLNQVDAKLQEVMSGKAPEYLEPLANLQENMQIRTKVAARDCPRLPSRDSPPDFHPATTPDFHPATAPDFHPATGPDFHPATGPDFHPATGPDFHPATAPDFHPATAPDFHPATSRDFHPATAPDFHPATAPDFHPAANRTDSPPRRPSRRLPSRDFHPTPLPSRDCPATSIPRQPPRPTSIPATTPDFHPATNTPDSIFDYPATPSRDFHPATTRDFHPATTRDFHPATTRDFHPATTRDFHPATTRDFHPATTPDFHPATTRDFHPTTTPLHPATAPDFHPATSRDFHPATSRDFHPATSRDFHPATQPSRTRPFRLPHTLQRPPPTPHPDRHPLLPSRDLPRLPSRDRPRLPSRDRPRLPSRDRPRLPSRDRPRLPSRDRPRLPSRDRPRLSSRDLPRLSSRIYRELCLESVKHKYDCETQAAFQHWESEKLLLFDTVQTELEEKIRRLEEDRHSIDITSVEGNTDLTFNVGQWIQTSVPVLRAHSPLLLTVTPVFRLSEELWNDELQSRKNKKKDPFSPDKKKKPVVVSDILQTALELNPPPRPYIIYMLQDLDILEDWTAIRKAMATLGPHRVKPDVPCSKSEKHQHSARSEDGRLFYDGEWYSRGQNICIDKKDEFPTSATITTINHDEVWFKRVDGSKSKLYISQLQKGKYTIKHG
ncbi:hypothetical protein NFI96_013576 [Prochilodus magdalenae]|nr:hypothetical protein NFI96_013576 [Prochilodus magdalenae]